MKNLLYIGNKLSKKGKTVTSIETLGLYLTKEGYKVRTASALFNKYLRLLDMLLNIIKYSRSTDYVLIDTYSTQNFYYAYICSQLCRLLNLKFIPILRGGNLPHRLKNNEKLSKAIFNNAYINISPSLYTKTEFENLGYTNLECIPNSIEIKNYAFKTKDYNTINLLWVRSFSSLYNPNLAIDILHELLQKNIKTSLCMIGPDNDGALNRAKSYAKSLNLEVEFTGKLSKKEWIDKAKNYNVFINTTNFDNMPVSVIENMALGLPIISTNVGGMPYLIDENKNGILLPPKNVNAFVDAILSLKNDTEKANSLAIAARNKVEQYDWDVVKLQWKSILK